MSKKLVIDADPISFAAASLAEERFVTAIHKQSGKEFVFKTATEFWGSKRSHDGGWLYEQNANCGKNYSADDFEVVAGQKYKLGYKTRYKEIVKQMFGKLFKDLGTEDYVAYVGRGDSFRREVSTILEYKSNRKEMMKPLCLAEVKAYMVANYNVEWVEGIEVDDKVVMECYNKPDRILVGYEKDYYSCDGITLYDPNRMGSPIEIKGLGKLWVDAKKVVRGMGRKFFYFQCLYGDSSDWYFANSASDKRWGDKSAFQALDPCKTDKECFQALVDSYKILYPEPKIITGWRGNEIEIDWMYVLQENFTLAHMLRTPDDHVDVKAVLDKLKVNY